MSSRIIETEIKVKVLVRVMSEGNASDEEVIADGIRYMVLDTIGGFGGGLYHWLGGNSIREVMDNSHHCQSREYEWVRRWKKERDEVCSLSKEVPTAIG